MRVCIWHVCCHPSSCEAIASSACCGLQTAAPLLLLCLTSRVHGPSAPVQVLPGPAYGTHSVMPGISSLEIVLCATDVVASHRAKGLSRPPRDTLINGALHCQACCLWCCSWSVLRVCAMPRVICLLVEVVRRRGTTGGEGMVDSCIVESGMPGPVLSTAVCCLRGAHSFAGTAGLQSPTSVHGTSSLRNDSAPRVFGNASVASIFLGICFGSRTLGFQLWAKNCIPCRGACGLREYFRGHVEPGASTCPHCIAAGAIEETRAAHDLPGGRHFLSRYLLRAVHERLAGAHPGQRRIGLVVWPNQVCPSSGVCGARGGPPARVAGMSSGPHVCKVPHGAGRRDVLERLTTAGGGGGPLPVEPNFAKRKY